MMLTNEPLRNMVCAVAALVCAVAGASDGSPAKQYFGLADTRSATVCIAMPLLRNTEEKEITLVTTGQSQKVFGAVIEREATTECDRLEQAMLPRPYYLAKLKNGTMEETSLAVAVLQPLAFKLDAGKVNATSSNGATYQFFECTGAESIHLFVWKTNTRSKKPIWHAYYYLPYTVEPSCGKGESKAMDLLNFKEE